MSKFKAGDRVKCVESGLHELRSGETYVVEAEHQGLTPGVVLIGHGGWYYDSRFELVEPLKLEVGATVVIDGGKDEWTVTQVYGTNAYLDRPIVGAVSVARIHLTVVKAKPEPPKPVDYYINCKGERPQDGDVFTGIGGAFYVEGKHYIRASYQRQNLYELAGDFVNSVGGSGQRTLVVRNGKPYKS